MGSKVRPVGGLDLRGCCIGATHTNVKVVFCYVLLARACAHRHIYRYNKPSLAGLQKSSIFHFLKSTFRDRRRRSEQLVADVYTDFVEGAVLWTWWWSSACSDFVAGAVHRDF